jgi:D-sedoheptulose 7-phosphate isomerase
MAYQEANTKAGVPMLNKIQKIQMILNYIKNDDYFLLQIKRVINLIINCLIHGNKILICGCGGSMADASHIATEFVSRFKLERCALPAICLNNVTAITAIANDYSFDYVFSRQVEAYGAKDDILIAISTSGNSKSVVNACRKANEIKMHVISFTGFTANQVENLSDHWFNIPSTETDTIQELYMIILHYIVEQAEQRIFGGKQNAQ